MARNFVYRKRIQPTTMLVVACPDKHPCLIIAYCGYHDLKVTYFVQYIANVRSMGSQVFAWVVTYNSTYLIYSVAEPKNQ